MLSLLCNVDFEVKDRFYENNDSYENLLANNYLEVINTSDFYSKFVQLLIESGSGELELEQMAKFVREELSNESVSTKNLVSLAISCLQAFAQINWLGPNTSARPNIPNSLIDENEIKSKIDFRIFTLSHHYGLNTEVFFQYFHSKIEYHIKRVNI
jgi:hypothetical protein